MENRARQLTKGWGPWKQTWFSICSMHYYHDDNCNMCTHGIWYFNIKSKISNYIFKKLPRFWKFLNKAWLE